MSVTPQQISESWENLTFDQAIEPMTDEGKRVDRSDYLSEGSLPVIDQGEEFIGGYTNDANKRYNGPLPVIVFGDHTRRVKLVDFPFVVGAQGVKLLKPRDCWEPRFLAYLLPTLPLADRGYGRHYQYLRQLRFLCPPKSTQREIVAEIEKQFTRLEAGVAGLRRVQANLKRYRAAVLKAACEGKLVPTEAELARQEGRTLPAPRPGVFFVYAIRCDNDSIYIGQTQDLQKRWQEHLAGQAADWTGQHKPVLIVHYEEYSSREEAVAREKWLKTGFGRKWLRREIAAGRARQAGYETGAQLLERILTERRQKWNGKGKYKEPEKLDTANLSPLPAGWVWGSATQIFMEVKDGTHDTPKYQRSGIPFITQKHIKPAGLVFDDYNLISKQDHERFYERSNPVRGDILVSMIGVNRGQSCIVTTDEMFSIKNVGLFKPYHLLSNVKFLQSYLSSLLGQKLILETSKGGAQPFIGLTELRAWPIPLPPIAEQQRIVAEVERRLSVVEELAAVVNANLQRASRLRQSILQRAFEGNLLTAELDRHILAATK